MLDLFQDYGNWLGEKYHEIKHDSSLLNFGDYIFKNLSDLYKEWRSDSYFLLISDSFVRANKDTNYVCLTDMVNVEKRDIRNWRKNAAVVKYIELIPQHYVAGNDSVDEFGFKVTFGHPDLALLLLDWLYKEDCENKERLTEFINNLKSVLNKGCEEIIIEESKATFETTESLLITLKGKI